MPRGSTVFAILALLALLAGGGALAKDNRFDEETFTKAAVPKSVETGPRDPKFPVWPLLESGNVVGYLFRTGDLVDIPGFSGTPIDLLIAMDKQGVFLDVRLLHQNEPVFVGGLGPEPLLAFLEQYKGKSVRSNIKVAAPHQQTDRENSINTYIDGISKASASVRIANETILNAAIKVAREKIADQLPKEAARARPDVMTSMTWQQLLDKGLVRHLSLSNGDVERAFAGTLFAGIDPELIANPDRPYVDLYYAQINVPSIGRNILGEESWQRLTRKIEDADEAIIVLSTGPKSFKGEDFVPGAVPDTLSVRQGDFPINLRNQVMDLTFRPGVPAFSEMEIFRIDRRSGFDPSVAWKLFLRIPRSRGYFLEEAINRDFIGDYALPAELFVWPSAQPERPWLAAWQSNQWELAVLGVALALLSLALAGQHQLAARPRLLAWGRPLFLAFVLGFIGWYAQGQLSIVTLLGLVKMVRGGDLSFLLYDPISLVLWVYVLITLLVWGRGTFCGWLCPFGALQELVSLAAARLSFRRLRLGPGWERRLSMVKYPVLAIVVGGTLLVPDQAENLAEVEPFKTAITVAFQRSWPFVAYAVAATLASLFVYKAYCRFLCPLGAALALPSWIIPYSWLRRRLDCGAPCQTCRKHCDYDAIRSNGSIRYADCFQCLDCVTIYHDPGRCSPLILEERAVRRARQAAGGAG
ncbi:MAG TPA: 4Fe-4S binding protein [Rhodospirillaceae bacterium]|nr:4Fe-4S binding protein [Rhodospirillaceae bacterium]